MLCEKLFLQLHRGLRAARSFSFSPENGGVDLEDGPRVKVVGSRIAAEGDPHKSRKGLPSCVRGGAPGKRQETAEKVVGGGACREQGLSDSGSRRWGLRRICLPDQYPHSSGILARVAQVEIRQCQ